MVDDYYYDDTRNVLLQEFPKWRKAHQQKKHAGGEPLSNSERLKRPSLFIPLTDDFNELMENAKGKNLTIKKEYILIWLHLIQSWNQPLKALEKNAHNNGNHWLPSDWKITKLMKRFRIKPAYKDKKIHWKQMLETVDQF